MLTAFSVFLGGGGADDLTIDPVITEAETAETPKEIAEIGFIRFLRG